MALIEEYHVVADMYPVDEDNNPNIIEGMLVRLNANGDAILANGAATTFAVGVAGDSSENSQGHTPYASNLVINSQGNTRSTSNRVSDFYNETAASNLITVYNSGGKFSTDQYVAATYVPGQRLYSNANGLWTNAAGVSVDICGICVVAPRDYPSGVPGTGTPDGSISLGDYMTFILRH